MQDESGSAVTLSVATPTGVPVRRVTENFFGWWGHELKALLPRQWTGDAGANGVCVVVQVERDELVCSLCRGEVVEEIGRFPSLLADIADAQVTVATLRPYLEGTAGAILRLPDQQILRRRVILPAAARENLRQVLAFEMDRQTPFLADDVYYDFQLLEPAPSDTELAVDLVVVPRKTLDALRATMQRLDVPLAAVDVMPGVGDPQRGQDPRINLLPAQQRAKQDRLMTSVNTVLAGLAVILIIGMLVIPLVRMHSAIAQLDDQLNAERGRAEQVAQLQDQLAARSSEARSLIARKQVSPPVIDVVTELARILPDTTWLRGLELQGEKLRIQGESSAASELIGLIEESPLFTQTVFVSPVTQILRTKQERFQIATEISPRG
ncbi:MAG: PilN domain-containing protein [Gammaproteobacteria bacterium]|nr:PilN domain-containing protein [Gammaproteobacteria bacterium]MDH3464293.1 PilN domain-containing protein [Gammaproteobacteria bacterium]